MLTIPLSLGMKKQTHFLNATINTLRNIASIEKLCLNFCRGLCMENKKNRIYMNNQHLAKEMQLKNKPWSNCILPTSEAEELGEESDLDVRSHPRIASVIPPPVSTHAVLQSVQSFAVRGAALTARVVQPFGMWRTSALQPTLRIVFLEGCPSWGLYRRRGRRLDWRRRWGGRLPPPCVRLPLCRRGRGRTGDQMRRAPLAIESRMCRWRSSSCVSSPLDRHGCLLRDK